MNAGWYSPTADYRCGHAVYLDQRGAEVKVTEVLPVGEKSTSRWTDLQYIGVITRFVRSESKLPSTPDPDDPDFWAKAAKVTEEGLKRCREWISEKN